MESVGHLFGKNSSEHCLILKSSSDMGVMRNGGRNGARFAPQSFLSSFKKLSQDAVIKNFSFSDLEVSDKLEEEKDFHSAQQSEAQRIKLALDQSNGQRLIHIGGGHDHIYPLLKAYSQKYQKISVINIDAHADTRTDENFHSGTPFRQFSEEYKGEFKLYQIGLHPFANSFSTLLPLSSGTSDVLWRNEFTPERLEDFFQMIAATTDEDTLTIFSLDADAMDASIVPGVSAVNPRGFSFGELLLMWNQYVKLISHHQPVLGIYELNPLYDSLASLSMRTMAGFVFETFRKE